MERDFLTFTWFFLSCISGYCLGMVYNDWRHLGRGMKILCVVYAVLSAIVTSGICAALCYDGLKPQFVGTSVAKSAMAVAAFTPIGLSITVMLITMCITDKRRL